MLLRPDDIGTLAVWGDRRLCSLGLTLIAGLAWGHAADRQAHPPCTAGGAAIPCVSPDVGAGGTVAHVTARLGYLDAIPHSPIAPEPFRFEVRLS